MDAKEFFRLTKGKLALFVSLMGGLNAIWILGTRVIDAVILVGLPLGFWPVGSTDTLAGAQPMSAGFSPANFAIDIIFWYLVSCITLFTYNARSRAAAEKADPANKVKAIQKDVMG